MHVLEELEECELLQVYWCPKKEEEEQLLGEECYMASGGLADSEVVSQGFVLALWGSLSLFTFLELSAGTLWEPVATHTSWKIEPAYDFICDADEQHGSDK